MVRTGQISGGGAFPNSQTVSGKLNFCDFDAKFRNSHTGINGTQNRPLRILLSLCEQSAHLLTL